MMERKELWRRVHDRLDARLDPLDDSALAADLLEAPDVLEEVVVLREALSRVGGLPAEPVPGTPRADSPLVAAGLALAAAVLLVVLALGRDRRPTAGPEGAAAGEIVSFRVRSSIEWTGGRVESVREPTGVRRVIRYASQQSSGAHDDRAGAPGHVEFGRFSIARRDR